MSFLVFPDLHLDTARVCERAGVEGKRWTGRACDLGPSSKHGHPSFKFLFGCLFSPSANNSEQNDKGHYQEPRGTAREAEMGLQQSQSISGGGFCPLRCVDRGHLSKLSDLVLEAADKEAASGTPALGSHQVLPGLLCGCRLQAQQGQNWLAELVV